MSRDADSLDPALEQPLTPDEGGGPPVGTAWSLVVDGDDGLEADLEHAAPLPRVGERVDFIGNDGRQRFFRVVDVIHTLQTSASVRPPVQDESVSPNATVDGPPGGEPPRLLRAGLPRVVVREEEA